MQFSIYVLQLAEKKRSPPNKLLGCVRMDFVRGIGDNLSGLNSGNSYLYMVADRLFAAIRCTGVFVESIYRS